MLVAFYAWARPGIAAFGVALLDSEGHQVADALRGRGRDRRRHRPHVIVVKSTDCPAGVSLPDPAITRMG